MKLLNLNPKLQKNVTCLSERQSKEVPHSQYQRFSLVCILVIVVYEPLFYAVSGVPNEQNSSSARAPFSTTKTNNVVTCWAGLVLPAG
jgi:hypothetical protein